VAPALRALRTAITHDPQLAASYAERIDTPRCEARKQRLRGLDVDLDVAVALCAPYGERRAAEGRCALTAAVMKLNGDRRAGVVPRALHAGAVAVAHDRVHGDDEDRCAVLAARTWAAARAAR
jgi:hypothetical protein